MNFHEKSAWAALLAIVVVFVPYFVLVFQQPVAFIGLMVVAVIVLVALLAGFHILNAIATPSIRKRGDVPTADELDQSIALRASKISDMVLSIVVLSWCLLAGVAVLVLNAGEAERLAATPTFSISGFQALTAVHALFAGFVLSNVVYYGAIILGYRKLSYG